QRRRLRPRTAGGGRSRPAAAPAGPATAPGGGAVRRGDGRGAVTVNGGIHDIGYQRYGGPRLGRGYAWRSLYQHSLRTAFGLGRGAKAKLVPWTPAAIILLVAVVLTVVRAGFGEMP